MDKYHNFYKGQKTAVLIDDDFVPGIIVGLGSKHASVTLHTGHTVDAAYSMLKEATIIKEAQANIIKEEEQDGNKFVLSKEEVNKDGEMDVVYKLTVNDKEIWVSEQITTNVYDKEFGWSAPDDFDDNKLDLIQTNAEAGFDLLVESYQTIQQTIQEDMGAPGVDGESTDAPKDVPAFAPGEGPSGGSGGSGSGGGEGTPLPEGAVIPGGAAADEEVPEGEEGDSEAPVEGETPPEEAPVEASIQAPFTRRIAKKTAAPVVTDEEVDVEYISDMIKEGFMSGYDPNWRLSIDIDGSLDDVDFESIGRLVATGVSEGPVYIGSSDSDDFVQGTWKLTKFTESVYKAKTDDRLHNNPQHRLNPILREEMGRRGIDSGNTNDLELSKKLKNFDYGGPSKKAIKRIENKLENLEV